MSQETAAVAVDPDIAKIIDDAIAATSTSTYDTSTFQNKYRSHVAQMIKLALDSALGAIIKAKKDSEAKLIARIEKLEKDLKSKASTAPLSYADVVSPKKTTEFEAVMLTRVQKEQREREKIENNIIVSGLNEGDDVNAEQSTVEELLTALGVDKEKVARRTRLKKRSGGGEGSSAARPSLLLVEFKDSATRSTAIKNARRLKDSERFKRVYVNIDKTAAQRAVDAKLRQERNKRNMELPNVNEGSYRYGINPTTNKKFYWAVRDQKLVQIEIKEQQ